MNKERLLGISDLLLGAMRGQSGRKVAQTMNGREFLRKDPVLRDGYFFRGSFHDTSSIVLIISCSLV